MSSIYTYKYYVLYIALVCVLITTENNVFPVINCIHNRSNRSPTVTISTTSMVINVLCVYAPMSEHPHAPFVVGGDHSCGDTLRDLREPYGTRCQLHVGPPEPSQLWHPVVMDPEVTFLFLAGMAWNSTVAFNNDPISFSHFGKQFVANSFMLVFVL